MGAMSQGGTARGPVVALLGWFGEYPYVCGGLTFWLALLMPTWVPLFLMSREARRQAGVRPFLAAVPAFWYGLSFWAQFIHTMPFLPASASNFLLGTFIAVGGIVACAMLAFCARGRWRILLVPLAIAIVAATISIEVNAWS
jgi:hypothetical protein